MRRRSVDGYISIQTPAMEQVSSYTVRSTPALKTSCRLAVLQSWPALLSCATKRLIPAFAQAGAPIMDLRVPVGARLLLLVRT